MKNTLRSLATASALVLMATSGALAEWKPSGPITMLIGFAAGGGADTPACTGFRAPVVTRTARLPSGEALNRARRVARGQ